jgi:hypothetical protein
MVGMFHLLINYVSRDLYPACQTNATNKVAHVLWLVAVRQHLRCVLDDQVRSRKGYLAALCLQLSGSVMNDITMTTHNAEQSPV